MLVLNRVAIALALAVCPTASPAQETALEYFPKRLLRAGEAAAAGDCRTALPLIAEELRQNNAIPEDVHNATLETAANCAGETGDFVLAYKYAVAGTKSSRSSDKLWRLKLQLELHDHRNDLALGTVESLVNGRGAALNSIPTSIFTQWDAGLASENDDTSRRRLFAVLTSSAYQPADSPTAVDNFRKEYVGLLIKVGAMGAAVTVISEIENPSIKAALSLDPRLHGMIPATSNPHAEATPLAAPPAANER